MAEFDPDAFLARPSEPPAGFDPDAFLRGEKPPPQGASHVPKFITDAASHLPSAIGDIPREIYNAGAAGLHEMNAINPWGQERTEARARGEAPGMGAVPRAAMGALGVVGSPITGAARSVGGHMLDLLNQGMRSVAVKMYGEDKVRQAEAEHGGPQNYETAKGDVDSLMLGLGPRGGMRPAVAAAAPAPPQADALGVMLSEGQRTGELPLIRREQAAARGQLGPAAEQQAAAFGEQQGQQVAGATENVRASLDPFGQVVAETPQEAGNVVSQSMQRAAREARVGVDTAYEEARALPGEIAPDTFTGMGTRIRDSLSNAAEPVIIDDKLTPYASQAIQDIDNRVAQLNIQNRASNTRTMAPGDDPPTIAGVTLAGVDQMRKRLSAFRSQAFGSGNASDGRAVRSVLNAFDEAIDAAVNSGRFTGDARAVQAWNDARAAHADYRGTFGSAGSNKDRVSGVVQKILGNRDNPAAIPNDVADFLYGSSGVNPGSLNVGVANRVRTVLGEQSPEWSAVKQGLFARLTETPPGVTDYGHGRIAQRLNKFLNGDGQELAAAVFSPAERQLLQQYAELQRRLEVPRTGANWSETSTFVAPMFRKISNTLAAIVGGVIGHTVAPGLMGVGEGAGALIAGRGTAALQNVRNARQISQQMPLIADRMARYQRALAAHQRANAPISQRALTIASTNLAKSLQPLVVDMYQLAPTRADEEKRQRGGRLEAEPYQGEGGKAHRANGGDAEARNRPYVRPIPSTYSTDLGAMEPMFRAWVAKNKVPFNPDGSASDYDMRGFYRGLVNGDPRAQSAVDPNDKRLHFPDVWKTPQHETFSNQSQWATQDAPQWNERDQLVAPSGHILFDDRAQNEQRETPKFASGGRVDANNIDHAPTEAQKKAGNYAKDHVHIHGLDITIENAKGAVRSGVDRGGKPWSVKMPAHYGYIKGTVGRDKDHVDVYIGPHPRSPHVFVVDQVDADSAKFDEHKAFLGFASAEQAKRAYVAAFSDGRGHQRLGHMAEMAVDTFKRWLEGGDTTQRIKGAEHDHKLTHKAVAYISKSRIPHKHCSVCSMFRDGPHCTLVKDPIHHGGYCRRFDPK